MRCRVRGPVEIGGRDGVGALTVRWLRTVGGANGEATTVWRDIYTFRAGAGRELRMQGAAIVVR